MVQVKSNSVPPNTSATLCRYSNLAVLIIILNWGPVPRFAPWKHCSQCGLLYDPRFSKRSYFGCQVPLASTTRGSPLAAKGGTMGEKWWPNGIFTRSSFTCHKSATWNREVYFPSEGRRAEDFYRHLKIRRLRPARYLCTTEAA